VNIEMLRQLSQRSIALDGGERHLGLEYRCVVPALSSAHRFSCARPSSPLSGRNSTYRPVQICESSSGYESERFQDLKLPGIPGVSMLEPVVRKGDVVTDFELPDETGAPRRLSGLLADGPVVLFFYPAAMSLGCTVESCHFRDLIGEFKAVGAQPVGISADRVERQRHFAEKHSLGYPLLSDSDQVVARQFGVRGWIPMMPLQRVTFVIDTDLTVLEVISSELVMTVHADRALEVLKKRQR
jgi:peroxiredoxin Q/BCP